MFHLLYISIGHEMIVQLLLQKGADMFQQDHDGNTALHKAAQNKHHHVIKLLLDWSSEQNRFENICNKKGLKAGDLLK